MVFNPLVNKMRAEQELAREKHADVLRGLKVALGALQLVFKLRLFLAQFADAGE